MHPPWITFHFFVIFLAATFSRTSGNLKLIEEKSDGGNVTRTQREIIERERRLIPYMTYYVAQSLTNPNSPRQNIFIPITPQRENVLQFNAIPQVPTNNLQNINPQQVDVLPKPIIRLPMVQNPTFITTPSIQTTQQRLQYKPKGDEIRVVGQIYRLEQPLPQPGIPSQVPPQPIQSETQPHQVIKVNSVPIAQKYVTPHIIKIIPVITKLPSGNRSPKSFTSSPHPQYAYTSTKLQTLTPHSYAVNNQNYYPSSVAPQFENSYQRNKVYAADVPQPNPQFKVTRIIPSLRPEKNKYTFAKIFLTTTTPSPYTTNIKFDINDARTPKIENGLGSIEEARLGPTSSGYTPSPIAPSLTTENHDNQQQIYYAQKSNNGQQSQIISQSSPEFVHQQTSEQLPRLRVPQEEDIKFVASVTPISVTNDLGNAPQYNENPEQKVINIYKQPTLDTFLSILKETNKLPQNLTPDNIDNGIKTLALILERLQQEKNYQDVSKLLSPTVSSTSKPATVTVKEEVQDHKKVHSFPQPSGTSTPGRPGIDYPIYSSIPPTKFDCSTQRYKGFFGDPDTKCQVWHYCDLNGGQASFLCPNGTIFSQVALTCDWWFNVKCASTSQLYVLNERLYKYILPFSPSFPEDYSGPVVDTYLTAKFKEMEAKSKSKALKSLTTSKPESTTDLPSDSSTELLEESRTISTEV